MPSDKEFTLTDYETLNTAGSSGFIKYDVDDSHNLTHTLPCEQGGLPMLDFANAMKSDAELQVGMLSLLSDRLDWLVNINDQRKVNHQAIESQNVCHQH